LDEKEVGKPKASSEKFIQRMMESLYYRDVNDFGFSGSLQDWKRKNEIKTRAIIAVQDGLYESEEQYLEATGHHEEARRLLDVQQKVTPAEVWAEAKVAGVDPKVMAEMINKSVDEAEEEDLELSTERRQDLFAEAVRAGVNMNDPKQRKRVLEIYEKIKKED
jgi:hypothetical protein